MIGREALRYLLAGGVNTAFSYAAYLLLLGWLHYRLAYLLSFVLGVLLSFVLLRHFVFVRPGRRHALLRVGVNHVVQLGLSLAVVELWVRWLQAPQALAPLAAVLLVMPVVFVLQRWVFAPHVHA